eukprot:753059-Pyramimonas_sp.AAC.1
MELAAGSIFSRANSPSAPCPRHPLDRSTRRLPVDPSPRALLVVRSFGPRGPSALAPPAQLPLRPN